MKVVESASRYAAPSLLLVLAIFVAMLLWGVVGPEYTTHLAGWVVVAAFGEIIIGTGLVLLVFREERVVVR
jgi:hypothetical protein